jgi:hypothetical protein
LPILNLAHDPVDLSIALHDVLLNAVYVLATFELEFLVFFEGDPSADGYVHLVNVSPNGRGSVAPTDRCETRLLVSH